MKVFGFTLPLLFGAVILLIIGNKFGARIPLINSI